jgi:PIN domain
MAFTVIYDANVLYPNTLRNLLIPIAQQPHLVGQVHPRHPRRDVQGATEKPPRHHGRKSVPPVQADEQRGPGLPGGNHQPLIAALDLPDPDDRHVLAAAIAVNAQVIVTRNRKDFPAKTLAQWNIRPKSQDDFVRDVIDLDSQAVWACVQQIVDSRTKRPVTVDDVLGELQRDGLVASTAALRMKLI